MIGCGKIRAVGWRGWLDEMALRQAEIHPLASKVHREAIMG
jgi:hypothetical protein